ncbi:hypothetical protein M3Y97_00645100 [Aphelenchoides bicaudatus]|nr:hypothetical protein M3Y97_00645100 [Aphelenchoides bicaudatus]
MVKRFSIYLTFASCASFMLVLTAVGLLVIEYKRGTVQEIYDSSVCEEKVEETEENGENMDALFCTKPLCSYGYQKMENNHLAIIIAAIGTIILFLTATVATMLNMRYVLSIGAFLVIDAVGSLLMCVTLYKQREKMETFVETILSANRAEGMQAGDQEFKQFVRQGRFYSYFENMRIAEYYYLQKWCAELERLRRSETDSKFGIRIDTILKEMQERAQIFGLNDIEAMRWRELASFPRLIIPEDTFEIHRSSSSNCGEYSVPHQRLHNHYQHLPASNGHYCDHDILQNFY